jgi:hypothetical protein
MVGGFFAGGLAGGVINRNHRRTIRISPARKGFLRQDFENRCTTAAPMNAVPTGMAATAIPAPARSDHRCHPSADDAALKSTRAIANPNRIPMKSSNIALLAP